MNGNYTIIKEYRKKAGLTQARLADLVGVSAAYIQQLEKGVKKNPSLRLIYLIAECLKINVDKLLDDETALYAYAGDRILNATLFKDIDYTQTNYIGSILDINNYTKTLNDLIKDSIKLIMYVENISDESISNSAVEEIRSILIEYLKIKDNIYNLNTGSWESADKLLKKEK
ncbi:helix-turn-helix domain-containing protein [Clostridium sp.]|uniref:helix-turn-helix domain-containing protein n=1 Tax=Clostridium sp. TaxID=1506 RepID=UPI0025BBBBDE|nr:helix-turn-helix domain-containing protein [Clostridium sp.]